MTGGGMANDGQLAAGPARNHRTHHDDGILLPASLGLTQTVRPIERARRVVCRLNLMPTKRND